MLLEWISFALLVMLIGFRHGMDLDHVAAITDMVAAERKKRRQLLYGALYAFGHGAIVVVIGLIAILIGRRLSDGMLSAMEALVGISLLLLGLFLLYSLFADRGQRRVLSRWQLLSELVGKLFRREPAASSAKAGIVGSFAIGVVHGIGAETPTQVALFSSTIGLNDAWLALSQLLLFTVGMLAATLLVTWLASWGFTKAQGLRFRWVYNALGGLTVGYSIWLGATILAGAL
ncbi:High-affinity nickel-transporter [Paenibacillus sp. TRM 82003]|nr:High-affinity nickel-transporter [Paenibacillus sp. TRM 82003]